MSVSSWAFEGWSFCLPNCEEALFGINILPQGSNFNTKYFFDSLFFAIDTKVILYCCLLFFFAVWMKLGLNIIRSFISFLPRKTGFAIYRSKMKYPVKRSWIIVWLVTTICHFCAGSTNTRYEIGCISTCSLLFS